MHPLLNKWSFTNSFGNIHYIEENSRMKLSNNVYIWNSSRWYLPVYMTLHEGYFNMLLYYFDIFMVSLLLYVLLTLYYFVTCRTGITAGLSSAGLVGPCGTDFLCWHSWSRTGVAGWAGLTAGLTPQILIVSRTTCRTGARTASTECTWDRMEVTASHILTIQP